MAAKLVHEVRFFAIGAVHMLSLTRSIHSHVPNTYTKHASDHFTSVLHTHVYGDESRVHRGEVPGHEAVGCAQSSDRWLSTPAHSLTHKVTDTSKAPTLGRISAAPLPRQQRRPQHVLVYHSPRDNEKAFRFSFSTCGGRCQTRCDVFCVCVSRLCK